MLRPVLRRARGPSFALSAAVLALGGAALAVALFAPSCRSTRPALRVHPVPAGASAALEEARAWARGTDALARERAWEAAVRARDLAPDWVAPRRLLDDFLSADLLGIEALAEHRRALEEDPGDAAEAYLAGRLEGRRGARRFQEAVQLDPSLAWGWHGLAWAASVEGDYQLALRYGQRALERSRDGWERSTFVSALARYRVAADQPEKALALLRERLGDPALSPIDHVELSVQAALIELSMVFQPEFKRGYERALSLLRECDLTDGEIEQLVRRMRALRSRDGSASLELQLALASRPSPARDRLRAELLLETRSTPLALGLLKRGQREGGQRSGGGPLLRAARFAAGQFALAVEEWLADLPRHVLAPDGLPRDPILRRVVELARASEGARSPGGLADLGEALLEAGWFREARSVASELAVHDLDAALSLEDRAAAGRELLVGLRKLMSELDEKGEGGEGLAYGSAYGEVEPSRLLSGGSANQSGLRGVLGAMSPAVARAQNLIGGETDEARVAEVLRGSPILSYGKIGALVHPGPRFSRADETAGLGLAGEPVPGFAELLDRIGRFGVFGQVLGGGGPDGTLLQRVLVEERRGEHLGVPWSGTIVWCEGADLRSRAGRLGANISGAALHEGYWVDFDALRRERDDWGEFERRFAGEENEARVQRALASRGLGLLSPPDQKELRRRERRDASTLLGQADRLRLAVLRDRLARARSGGRQHSAGEDPALVSLDELALLTALHEEGHLCDRTRFMPIGQNLGRVMRLLLSVGFSPSKLAQRLEYRAQLVALCEAPDPRIPLVEVLRAAEGSSSGVTPHGGAYRELLADLLATLDREIERHPGRWPEIDPGFVLVHQLHWLAPERLRALARKQARREGLIG